MSDYTVGDVVLTLDDLYFNKIGIVQDTFAFKRFRHRNPHGHEQVPRSF